MARYINLYLENREYGGPEEGGWYYDSGEIIRSIPCLSQRQVDRVLPWIKKIADAKNIREDRRNLSSVISDGFYKVRVERSAGQNFPSEPPHYE